MNHEQMTEFFMRKAIEKARQGIKEGQTPFGACIVRKGKEVVSAHNVVWKTTDITAHGEVNAIRLACKKLKKVDLSDCTIYSTCEPCPMCFSAIHWARIKKVFYGADIRDAKKAGFNELHISNEKMKKLGKSTMKIEKGLLRKECAGLFTEFVKRNGKTY